MSQQAKDAPINIRAKPQQRDLIDRAALLVNKSRTDFILDVACREAEDLILDQRLLQLSDEQYQHFIDIIESPLDAKPGTKDIREVSAPWE